MRQQNDLHQPVQLSFPLSGSEDFHLLMKSKTYFQHYHHYLHAFVSLEILDSSEYHQITKLRNEVSPHIRLVPITIVLKTTVNNCSKFVFYYSDVIHFSCLRGCLYW